MNAILHRGARVFLPVLASLALLRSAPPLSAQEVTGHIEGRLIDHTGAPVVNVAVEVRGSGLPSRRLVLSDEAGRFRILGLPAGVYRAVFRHIGYHELRTENIPVTLGGTTALGDVRLQVQTLDIAPIVIEGERPVIDPRSTAAATFLDHAAIDLLPLERDYMAAVAVLPQANESYYGDGLNISGATGFDNAVFIDGVNVTEPYRGQGATRLPYNFIDHLELRTGGFEAEHGRSLGGIVGVITRSGGNEFRGSAFGYFTGSSLASTSERGIGDLSTGDFRKWDIGFGVGGPVKKERLWYYAAYDRNVEQSDVQLQGLGVRTDKTVSHLFAGKLTWQPAEHTDISFTLTGDPARRDLVGNEFWAPIFGVRALANAEPFAGLSRSGGVLAAVRASRVFGSNLIVEGNVARLFSQLETGSATMRGRVDPLVINTATGTWSGGYGNFWDHESTRWSAGASVTAYRGEHSVKAGVQLEHNRLDEVWQWLSDNGPGDAGLVLRNPGVFVTALLDFQTVVTNRVAAAYAQASLLLHPRLRVNPGLRWEAQYFRGRGSGLSGSIADQYQPRLGVVFYPSLNKPEKVTASFARFYEQLPNLAVSFGWGGLYQEFPVYFADPFAGATPDFVSRFWVVGPKSLDGQHYDELTLGYQRALANERLMLSVRGIHRELRKVIASTSGLTTPDTTTMSNPGFGALAYFPKPKHDYDALELMLQTAGRRPYWLQVAYTLSRTRGNYSGLFDQDTRVPNPNGGSNYTDTLKLRNGVGALPNDRPHVLKVAGGYRSKTGLALGTYFTAQSGTPLNEYGTHPADPLLTVFLRPRGTAGRTSAIWDWNIHASQDLARFGIIRKSARLRADLLHAFSQRQAVSVIQQRYLAVDQNGQPSAPNPLYLAPLAHQPPMTLRLGLEVAL